MSLPLSALLPLLPFFLLSAAQNPSRTMTFVNQCSSTVYFSPTTGAAGSCASGESCPSGSTCSTQAGVCYWDNPTPSLGNYAIPSGQKSVVTYPGIDGNTAWSGNYAFCVDGTTCNADADTCMSEGCRAAGPYNQAEITMAYNGVDFYDISNIGGINVPMSMHPSTYNRNGDPYTCSDAGAVHPLHSGLGASSWQFDVPSVDYNWVSGGSAASCEASSDCSNGEVCGNVWGNGAWSLQCGKLSGFWTENAVCAYGVSTDYFDCTQGITNGPNQGTLGQFQGCGVSSGSCYQPGADEFCCGCANWNETLSAGLVPSSTAGCVNQNAQWQQTILPTLQWIKAAAPNAYTFPYDDMSSTFTCGNNDASGINAQNYIITLCPAKTELGVASAPSKRSSSSLDAGHKGRRSHKGMSRL